MKIEREEAGVRDGVRRPECRSFIRGATTRAPGAVRLYEDLLSDTVAVLPPGITRLVMTSDGALHRLPFEALRAAPDGVRSTS